MSRQLQPFIRQYLEPVDLSRFVGVSLTMKQMVDQQKIDPICSSQNLRHFLNVLNKKVYRNRFSRFGLRLQVFPVLENSFRDRLHYHMILERPVNIDPRQFESLIHSAWKNTRFGYREIHIDQSIDAGWIKYITKFCHNEEQVDWENVHLNR